jgi:hypothetical protein
LGVLQASRVPLNAEGPAIEAFLAFHCWPESVTDYKRLELVWRNYDQLEMGMIGLQILAEYVKILGLA